MQRSHTPLIRRAACCVAVAAALLLTACADVVDGTQQAGPFPSGTSATAGGPTGFPATTSGAPPVTSPAPVSSPAPAAQPSLGGYLLPAPAGSRPGTTAWDRTPVPTLAQFVREFYDKPDWKGESVLLRAQGLRHIAHRVWIETDDAYADVVLLQFLTSTGATLRYTDLVTATRTDTSLVYAPLPGAGRAVTFYARKKDTYGNIVGRSYAVVGGVMIELFTFSVGRYDAARVRRLITGQVARLP